MAFVQDVLSGKKGLPSTTIKIIAVITMFIDHLATIFFPTGDTLLVSIMHLVGKIAFVLFAFCIAEGFSHTSNRKKYALRLIVAAVLSEPAYNIALVKDPTLFFRRQNVIFTFFIAFCVLCLVENIKNKDGLKGKKLLMVLTAVGGMLISELTRTEYGCMGVGLVLIFYLFREKKVVLYIASSLTYFFGYVITLYISNIYNLWYSYVTYMEDYERKKDILGYEPQFKFDLKSIISNLGSASEAIWKYALEGLLVGAIVAPAIIMLYNGKKGRTLPKLAFYVFYPAHLMFLSNLMILIQFSKWIY